MAISNLKAAWDRWTKASRKQSASPPVPEPPTINHAAPQQTRDWDRWDEVQTQRESRKTVRQLHAAAHRTRHQAQYDTAAALFAEAAELARQQGDLAAQAKNLYWEGHTLWLEKKLNKALTRFLQADALNALDSATQFYNLFNIVLVALDLPLPLAEQRDLLAKLAPYRGSQQLGGSKSMVLIEESAFLSRRGLDAEALAKSQEAFASRVSATPRCNDYIYFQDLAANYRLNGQYDEARKILRQWKAEANHNFAREKSSIICTEAQLLYAGGNAAAAWDLMQQCYAEERYIGRAGKELETLVWLIRIGSELGYFDQTRPFLRQVLPFRHSESLFKKYDCFLSLARYCCHCCIRGGLSPADHRRMHRHARFWLRQAQQTAQTLDNRLECDWRIKQVAELRRQYEASCN